MTRPPWSQDPLTRLTELVEHRAHVLRQAIKAGDPAWIHERYMKLADAQAALKREFKRSTFDLRSQTKESVA